MAKSESSKQSVHIINTLHLALGRGAHIYFEGNPQARLSRADVNHYCNVIGRNDDEAVLSLLINEDFRNEVHAQGMTLVQCLQAAKQAIDSHRSRPHPIETASRFAGLLSRVAPEESGRQLLDRLQALIGEFGEAAAQLLDQHEARNGRDQDGFILLRGKQEVQG